MQRAEAPLLDLDRLGLRRNKAKNDRLIPANHRFSLPGSLGESLSAAIRGLSRPGTRLLPATQS
jgi:hypothetical protein